MVAISGSSGPLKKGGTVRLDEMGDEIRRRRRLWGGPSAE